jgi:uncharacterized protein YjbI with pentapeptide repeats
MFVGEVMTREELEKIIQHARNVGERPDSRDANLRSADLRSADLRSADIDFSCWPLWCGSKSVKVDDRIAMQLLAHFCCLDCDSDDYQKAKSAILDYARKSHVAGYLDLKDRL